MSSVSLYAQSDLDAYLKEDYILERLEELYKADAHFVSQQWMLGIPAKRMIYADIYGPLLKDNGKRILDVGGGFCGLSRELIKKHNYTLLEIAAHDTKEELEALSSSLGNFWVNEDWHSYQPQEEFDVVIANDLFPNVDQRLSQFIEKYQSHTKELWMTLTTNDNREVYYVVQRIDADEVLTMAPWTRAMTEYVLKATLDDENFTLPESRTSLFRNGRAVYKLTL